MVSVEKIPGMEGVNSSMIYLIYCKNFWKCHTQHDNKKIKIKKKSWQSGSSGRAPA
jgi:hypothetical protein